MTGITVREVSRSRVRVVVLRADLDRDLADRVRPALMEAANAGRDVIVDMRGVSIVDSAGLGLLVRAHRAAKRRGATLCLVAPSRFVQTVLHTMHLDGVFPVHRDVRTALAASTRTVGDRLTPCPRAEPTRCASSSWTMTTPTP